MPPPAGGRSQTSLGFTRDKTLDDDGMPALGHGAAPAASHSFEARKKNLDPTKKRDLMSPAREKGGAPPGSISGIKTFKQRQQEREERSKTLYR